MAEYVDGFVIAVPKKNIEQYKKMSKLGSKVWREYGALDYRECIADDIKIKFGTPYNKLLNLKPNETVIFAWITFKSRAQRDKINKKVMEDPRIQGMCGPESSPFDIVPHDLRRIRNDCEISLNMDRASGHGQRRFLRYLFQRRVRVACAGDVFRARAKFHGNNHFCDQRTRFRPHNVASQNLVRFCVRNDFHKTFRRVHRTGAAIRHERELTDLVLNAVFFQIVFRFTDGGNFRESVNNTGNQVVIDMAGLTRQHLGKNNALVLRFVRQHRPDNNVTDRIDTGNICFEMTVRFHAAALIQLNARLFQAKPLRKRLAANGDKNDLGGKLLGSAASGRLNGKLNTFFARRRRSNLRTKLKSQTLFG